MIPPAEELEKRLTRLERENALWKRGALFAAVLIGGALATGAAKAHVGTVDGSTFRLVDPAGNSRAALTLSLEGLPRLTMSDSKGKVRCRLGLDATGTASLQFSDPDDTVWATITRDEERGACVSLLGGKATAVMAVGSDGTPKVSLGDAEGTERATLGCTTILNKRTGADETTPPSSLRLFDERGRVVYKAP
jgi:hypothetical protein